MHTEGQTIRTLADYTPSRLYLASYRWLDEGFTVMGRWSDIWKCTLKPMPKSCGRRSKPRPTRLANCLANRDCGDSRDGRHGD